MAKSDPELFVGSVGTAGGFVPSPAYPLGQEAAVAMGDDALNDQGTGFVSKMHMHSQETPRSVIEQEQAIVAEELGLSGQDDIVFDDEGWDSRVYLRPLAK